MAPIQYPKTRTTDDVTTLAGVPFPDPYRWLHDETGEVGLWQDEQGDLAAAYVRDWPDFEALRARVEHFTTARMPSFPSPAGDRWVRTHTPEGRGQALVLLADEPYGPGTVLYDPASEDAATVPFVSWVSPSPDGRIVAIGVCADGSERNRIRLVDTATGALVPGAPARELMDNWTGGAHWLPDSSGFFFTAIEGRSTDLDQDVWLHRVAPAATTRVDVPWPDGKDYRVVVVAADGRHAVATYGMQTVVPVAVAPIVASGELVWRPFVTERVGNLPGHLVGDEWIAVTDVGAPRGRLVSIGLDSPAPNDPSTWTELVAESDAVMRSVTAVGDRLYVVDLVDTFSQVRVFDRAGTQCGVVPLPGRGAVSERPFAMMSLFAPGRADEFMFGFSTLTTSRGYYRHRPGAADLEVLAAPERTIPDAVVEDGWATSPDGTRIPYHLVRRRDVLLNRPRPTLMHGYGGFNAAWLPEYPREMAAFVDAGGVFVHCHLRGGSEFGRDWWDAGRLRNKTNGYADLYAIAEDLIATGVSSPNLLALSGGSNGGMLCGVAVTQRPNLWAAVVPRVPFMDAIGVCGDGYGRYVVNLEFADVEDPDEVRRLAGFSPYHLIRDGVDYPAVFVDAGDTDPRCPPWHARKFAARLQAATTGDAPVLVRIWRNVGHGWATDQQIALTENTEWLAFVMKTLGLRVRQR